jgi:Peptidase S46
MSHRFAFFPRMNLRYGILTLIISLIAGLPLPRTCDEGMWLFCQLPRKLLSEKYGFDPQPEWSERLMRSTVRFNNGGSGSFVSSRGLVLTNQHVGADTLQKLSSDKRDFLKQGFLALSADQELPAPDLELNQLVSITSVTDRVNQAVAPDLQPADAASARRKVIADIELEFAERTGNRCDVVAMFGGGEFHVYEYRRFTDVRLVWAPEKCASRFGGDVDNFEYPRHCLDACLFRVYENGEPLDSSSHFLEWSERGPEKGELVFVSGNPGSTCRSFTSEAFRYERDVRIPDVLDFVRRREILLQQFTLLGQEQKRQAAEELAQFQNARKAYAGMLAGLQNPDWFDRMIQQEQQQLAMLATSEKLAPLASAWEDIARVQQQKAALGKRSFTLNTRLFWIALTLVRLADEDVRPNNERLPDFSESNRPSLLQKLLSEAPVHADLERVKLADLIARTLEIRGADDPLCKEILGGMTPRNRADSLIGGTRLSDANERQKLVEGGSAAIRSSSDPLLEFARIVDGELRAIQAASDELDELETQAYARIAEARFSLDGTESYPDATFTLRISFGVVKGYEQDGKKLPAWMTFGSAFAREADFGRFDPFVLPESWHEARRDRRLDVELPLNFVCTADIIGGSSGSPVVNRDLELVGVIFDGNVQSLTADFYYCDKQARAIAVHSEAIRAALRYIYESDALADELGR